MKNILAFSFAVAAVYACGGAIDPGLNDSGTNDGSPAQDASSPHCPSSPPSGGACSPNGITCEYGSDPNYQCNEIVTCSNSEWSFQMTTDLPCPTQPNSSSCPDSFADVPVGQLCGAIVGTTCSYPQGFCGCSVGSGGPYPVDAAAVATWICDAPESGCPMPRPHLGAACSQEGLQCDYSTCSLEMGESVVCQNGAWQDEPYGCAL